MQQNPTVTAFTVSELLRENQQGVKLPHTHTHAKIRVKIRSLAGFNNYHKIAVRNHVHVPKFWRT